MGNSIILIEPVPIFVDTMLRLDGVGYPKGKESGWTEKTSL